MEDLLEGLLELAIQEATIKARDVVKLRGGDKAAYVAKAKEAAEKIGSLLRTYEKESLIPQTKNCENALGKLIKNATDLSQPPEAVNEALRDYLIQLKTLNTMFKELSGAPPMPPPPPPGGGKGLPPPPAAKPTPATTPAPAAAAPKTPAASAPVAAPVTRGSGPNTPPAAGSPATVKVPSPLAAATAPAAAVPRSGSGTPPARNSGSAIEKDAPRVRAGTASAPRVDESKIAAAYSTLFGEESPNSFAAKVADAPAAAAASGKAELPDFEQLLNGEGGSDARFEVQEYDLQPKKMVHASVSQKDSFDANKSLIKNLWGGPRKK